MDEQLAYRIGRGFARVLSDLQDTPVEELTVGLGRDMRLSAPSMAAEYARGIADEGADVLDIGMVGTEQLYWTVGVAGARRRAHVHRLAQPAGLHGREAREARRARALGRLGHRRAARDRDRRGAGTAGRTAGPDHDRGRGRRLPQGRARVHRPGADHAAEGGARRQQRHGRSDGGPTARQLPDRAGAHLLGAGRRVPRPRAQPAARGEPPLHHRQGAARPAPSSASPGTATPTAASSSTTPAASWTATS